MNLQFGDSFKGVFEKYGITKKDVYSCYTRSDKFEALDNGITLFLKSLQNEENIKNVLLIATQKQNEEDLLAFAYWIPKDIFTKENSCLDVLEVFTNRFGFKIKVGSKEGYFVKRSNKMIYGKIENPNDLIEVLVPQQVPCEYFVFTSENMLGTINNITTYYSFAINTSKYIFWLESVPFVQLEIKSGWYDYVKNIVNYVEPSGKTHIQVIKQKFTDKLEPDQTNNKTKIEVPINYENQFRYIVDSINQLKNKEKILLKISFSSPKCLFCNSPQTSKEHIFSKWLRPHLPETILEGTQFMRLGDEPFKDMMDSSLTPGKKESSKGYTTDLVCTNCNNTWMSKLENQVKQILVKNNKLIDNIPADISKSEANILSQWLILKALLLSNKVASNIHELPQKIFSDLKDGNLDNGFIVEFSKAENNKLDFAIIKGSLNDKLFILRKIPLNIAKEMANNLFICCIHLGNMMFRVSYLDNKIPLKRISTLYNTFTLFPFNGKIDHKEFSNSNEFLKNLANKDLEIHLFSHGLLLSD
jgi:hypothetical protein